MAVSGAPTAFLRHGCGTLYAMIARVDNDTSSRPAKDLGGTLRRMLRTTPRSYDSRASGDQFCSPCLGCVANRAKSNKLFTVWHNLMSDTMAAIVNGSVPPITMAAIHVTLS